MIISNKLFSISSYHDLGYFMRSLYIGSKHGKTRSSDFLACISSTKTEHLLHKSHLCYLNVQPWSWRHFELDLKILGRSFQFTEISTCAIFFFEFWERNVRSFLHLNLQQINVSKEYRPECNFSSTRYPRHL